MALALLPADSALADLHDVLDDQQRMSDLRQKWHLAFAVLIDSSHAVGPEANHVHVHRAWDGLESCTLKA